MSVALAVTTLALLFSAPGYAQTATSAAISQRAAITADRTPVTPDDRKTPEVTRPEASPAAPILVVTTNLDDAGNSTNCTEQAVPGTGTDEACSLRDALLLAAQLGSGNISFSSTVFRASNTAAENTIHVLAQTQAAPNPVPFTIPAETTVTGPTAGTGASETNLVTIAGQIGGVSLNGAVILQVNQNVTGVSVIHLNLYGGQGAIKNAGSMTVTGCVLTHNTSYTNGGGIDNSGTMSVSNTTIANNIDTYFPQTTGGAMGGGIYNSATLTLLDSTISGNTASGTNAYGGGIYNTGELKLLNTTLAGNAANSGTTGGAPFSGGGGGIYSAAPGTVTLTSTTISGNSVTGVSALYSNTQGAGGGGIGGTVAAQNIVTITGENSIISGNTSNVGAADFSQVGFFDGGGNIIGLYDDNGDAPPSPINLMPLGNYGGMTQTMLPMPQSPAICGGSLANVTSSGLTTDQRALPRTTSYDFSGSYASCVDSGAVQTNYSLSFTVQPPANAALGIAMSPAPAVKLFESGNPITDSSAQVGLFDSAQVLTDPTRAMLVNGVATFTDAIMTGATTNDSITAQLPLTYGPSVLGATAIATASQRVTVPTVPAVLVSPAPGSTLTSGTVTFTWSASDVPGTQYGLIIGTQGQGSSNIYDSGTLTGTSVTVTLPTTGATLYVGLTQGTTGPWMYTPYTYKEATIIPAVLTSPTPGSILTSGTVTFKWTASTIPGTQYALLIGTTGPGSKDVYLSPPLTGTSVTVTVPTTGATLYVGLTQGTTGPWMYTPYTYKEATIIPAVLTSPTPGSTLTSGTVTFKWTASTIPGTQYALLIGTTGPGSKDVYLSPPLTGTSVTVSVPTTGAMLYVGLTQGTTGPWMYTPYTYKEATIIPAVLTSPAPGSTLTSGKVTFNWTKSTMPGTQYALMIGTTGPGSKEVYLSPPLTGTSVTVKVPTTGATLYVGFTQGTTGQWMYTPYTFKEAKSNVKKAAAIKGDTEGISLTYR